MIRLPSIGRFANLATEETASRTRAKWTRAIAEPEIHCKFRDFDWHWLLAATPQFHAECASGCWWYAVDGQQCTGQFEIAAGQAEGRTQAHFRHWQHTWAIQSHNETHRKTHIRRQIRSIRWHGGHALDYIHFHLLFRILKRILLVFLTNWTHLDGVYEVWPLLKKNNNNSEWL